ncbi:conserved hypothetical protein TIGR00250 [gamma proteobacterium HTCC5015]|nr:conserved hypothetical protein TIGR00250 [gamma proteobacterium HTCC5015]
MNTLLGIDFGLKRIGIATGQTLTCSATPLTTLPNHAEHTNWDGLDKVLKDWKPDAIVLGLPLNKDGSDHALTKQVRQFRDTLGQHFSGPIHWQDERASSREAEQSLTSQRASGDLRRKVKKEDIDQLAAALILQRWLNKTP